MRRPFAVLLLLAIPAAACLFPQKTTDLADGAQCGANDECKSGSCFQGSCSGSSCTCPGGPCKTGAPVASPDCAQGWLCSHYQPGTLSSLFGADSKDSCKPTCGHCPLHYMCTPDEEARAASGDAGRPSFCDYDATWDAPRITIESPAVPDGGVARGAAGETMVFRASATSPAGRTITSYSWRIDSAAPATVVEGQEARHLLKAGPLQATLTVKDDAERSSTETVRVAVCGKPGDVCYRASDDDACCAPATCQTQPTGGMRCQ